MRKWLQSGWSIGDSGTYSSRKGTSLTDRERQKIVGDRRGTQLWVKFTIRETFRSDWTNEWEGLMCDATYKMGKLDRNTETGHKRRYKYRDWSVEEFPCLGIRQRFQITERKDKPCLFFQHFVNSFFLSVSSSSTILVSFYFSIVLLSIISICISYT